MRKPKPSGKKKRPDEYKWASDNPSLDEILEMLEYGWDREGAYFRILHRRDKPGAELAAIYERSNRTNWHALELLRDASAMEGFPIFCDLLLLNRDWEWAVTGLLILISDYGTFEAGEKLAKWYGLFWRNQRKVTQADLEEFKQAIEALMLPENYGKQ